MPSLTIHGGIEFSYTDSGEVESSGNITNLVLIHGNSFGNGVFCQLEALAPKYSLRIFSVSRRGYAGSTPYSEEELRELIDGPFERQMNFLDEQGLRLALFVDGLILKHELHKDSVVIGGWSLGCLFMCLIIGAINSVDSSTRIHLSEAVRSFILWDPVTFPLGIPLPPDFNPYNPLIDSSLVSQANKLDAFAKFVSSYYTHPNLQSQDPSQLELCYPDTDRKATIENMTLEERSTIIDVDALLLGDSISARIDAQHLLKRAQLALLDPEIRKAWGNPSFFCLWGEKTPWLVPICVWALQDMFKESDVPELTMRLELIRGVNHLMMWDNPVISLEGIKRCLG